MTCANQFGVPCLNTTDRVTFKQQKLTPPRPGGGKSAVSVLGAGACSEPPSWCQAFAAHSVLAQ